ncbi:hypothetical protein EJ03DRAFT_42315 [Teratosphaeria nubilosa]|uniref:F-box domain-containing protein n=1 Tax=Teratosphaeria nubilosa TaxID=161662 RepID=A0A6G1KTQ0_9PEZI|nr:hypothetical protein EJ03DRAFT_42315 [Teratosphaeria nubilosa]
MKWAIMNTHEAGDPRPMREYREKFVDNPITRYNRQEFMRVLRFQLPNPQDAVYWQTKPILKAYNKKSPRHESDPLQIEALNIAPTLSVEPYETVPVVHCLVRHELFIKLQLKMVCDIECGWSKSSVMVRDDDRWITLEKLLHGLPDPTMPGCVQQYHNAQFRRWRRNGKTFAFARLPAELQKKILLSAIGEYVQPVHHTLELGDGRRRVVVHLTGGTPREWGFIGHDKTKLPPLRPVNPALFSLNKATRRVALEVLWADTTKRYSVTEGLDILWHGDPSFVHSLTTIPSQPSFINAPALSYLRHLQLDYSNAAYANMFGCPMRPMLDEQHSTLGPALQALPNLRSLELHFQSTTDRNYSPWIAALRGWTPLELPEMYPQVAWDRLPCQKTLHDWILLWAAEHLMGLLAQVRLTGYIKTLIRKKWQAVINSTASERAEILAWIEEEKKSVRASPLGDRNL